MFTRLEVVVITNKQTNAAENIQRWVMRLGLVQMAISWFLQHCIYELKKV